MIRCRLLALVALVPLACQTRAARTPQTAAAVVSPTTLNEADTGPPQAYGLVATLEDGERKVVTWASAPHFTLEAHESLHPNIKPAFTANWQGELVIEEAGHYQFFAAPATLRIDGQAVGESGVMLEAGAHTLQLAYTRSAGPVQLQVQWAAEGFAQEPLPAAVLRPTPWPSEARRWTVIDEGRRLYDDLGCRGCHQRKDDDPHVDEFYHLTRRGRGPGLGRLGRRLQPAWVHAWLSNPRKHRSNAKMPVVLHDPQDRSDVTAFLMSLQEQGATTGVEVVPWQPEPLSDQEAERAQTLFDTIGCAACHGEAPTKVPLDAVGSKFIPFALAEYIARPENFDHSGRMPGLARGEEARLLAMLLLRNRKPELEAPAPPGDARRGRQLVESKGCLGCHSIDVAGAAVWTALETTRFEQLPSEARGCLSAAPVSAYARYELTSAQREALVAFLAAKDVASAPSWELARTLDSRGCRQCHETDQPARNHFSEMPPSLRLVGDKLRPEFIAQTVDSGRRLRPWSQLRMPRFHRAGAVGKLLAASAGASTTTPAPNAVAAVEDRLVQEGVQYLGRGEGGMSCVTCHRFGEFDPKSATPAPDLTTAVQRLRPEWFVRWLRDPGRLAPGTQMPAFFSGVEPEFSEARIKALWAALSLGRKMPAPEGVDLSNARLPYPMGTDPVVVRTFLEGSGPRSLAVGFKGAAFAFDTEACRLVYTWRGSFLDMKPVWLGRGGDQAVPMGKISYRAPQQPMVTLRGHSNATPTFKGYQLEKGGPVLRYEVGPVQVEDRIRPAGASSFERVLTLRGPAAEIALNLDAQTKLESPRANPAQLRLERGRPLMLKLQIVEDAAAGTLTSQRP